MLMLQGDPLEQLSDVRKLSHAAHAWLSRHRTKSFYAAITAETLRLGVQSMLQVDIIYVLLLLLLPTAYSFC